MDPSDRTHKRLFCMFIYTEHFLKKWEWYSSPVCDTSLTVIQQTQKILWKFFKGSILQKFVAPKFFLEYFHSFDVYIYFDISTFVLI